LGTTVSHAAGCALTGGDTSGIPAAVALANAADIAVLVLGGSSARTTDTPFDANGAALAPVSEMTCGEGVDLASLRLGAAQRELLRAVAATGTPAVVVLLQGRPHAVPEAAQLASALLTAWYPGPWGGDAIAEVLLGHTGPTGRLPVSVPRSAGQLPVYYNHKDTEYTGYADTSAEPLYSFGHGLGYTRFAFGPPRLSQSEIPASGQLTCEVEVSNAGPLPGRAVAQLYVRRLRTPVWPRALELRAFRAVELAPGERSTVRFALGAEELEQVGPDLRPAVLPGSLEIRVAGSACDALAAPPALLRVVG
jgi:beta-glucosidase